jgi:hypothetical protein
VLCEVFFLLFIYIFLYIIFIDDSPQPHIYLNGCYSKVISIKFIFILSFFFCSQGKKNWSRSLFILIVTSSEERVREREKPCILLEVFVDISLKLSLLVFFSVCFKNCVSLKWQTEAELLWNQKRSNLLSSRWTRVLQHLIKIGEFREDNKLFIKIRLL